MSRRARRPAASSSSFGSSGPSYRSERSHATSSAPVSSSVVVMRGSLARIATRLASIGRTPAAGSAHELAHHARRRRGRAWSRCCRKTRETPTASSSAKRSSDLVDGADDPVLLGPQLPRAEELAHAPQALVDLGAVAADHARRHHRERQRRRVAADLGAGGVEPWRAGRGARRATHAGVVLAREPGRERRRARLRARRRGSAAGAAAAPASGAPSGRAACSARRRGRSPPPSTCARRSPPARRRARSAPSRRGTGSRSRRGPARTSRRPCRARPGRRRCGRRSSPSARARSGGGTSPARPSCRAGSASVTAARRRERRPGVERAGDRPDDRAVVVGAEEALEPGLLGGARERDPLLPGHALLALDHQAARASQSSSSAGSVTGALQAKRSQT